MTHIFRNSIILLFFLFFVVGGGWFFFSRNIDESVVEEKKEQTQVVPVKRKPAVINAATESEPRVDPKPDDNDRDGLTNEEEIIYGTNARDFDSDNDFIKDGDEVHKYKTNPLVADSDGDGFGDYIEIQNGYNPNGDGLLNTNQ